jgi:hypothetical protein
MFIKGAVVASGLLAVGLTVGALNLPAIYNGMYPADGLKRGVLGLCHETDLSFVRAAQGDREACYERMPHAIAVAIGWARHSSPLIEPPPPKFGTLEAAELFLTNAAALKTQGALAGLLTADPTSPTVCDDTDKFLRVARPIPTAAQDVTSGGKSHTAVALLPAPQKPAQTQQAFPVLPPTPAAQTLPGPGPGQNPRRTAAAHPKIVTSTGSSTPPPSLEFGGMPASDLDDRPAMSLSPRSPGLPCPGA